MVATRHDMREVEIVEGDGTPGAGHPLDRSLPDDDRAPIAPEPVGAHRPHGRHRRWVVALLLIALALAGGHQVTQARARTALAALAAVDGVLDPLTGPVGERWRTDRAVRSDLMDVAGLLVGVIGRVGRADVIALDPATGATVWRVALRPMGPSDGGGGIRCVVPEPAGPDAAASSAAAAPSPAVPAVPAGDGAPAGEASPVVVCVVDRFPPDRRSSPPADPVTTDRIVVLDARTGAVVAQRPVERSTSLAALGGDVVTAHGDPDGYVHVSREDPLGSAVRWDFVSPSPLAVRHPGWRTRMEVIDGLVVVDEADGSVLDGDGHVLHSWTGTSAVQLEGMSNIAGGRLLLRPHTTGGPYPQTRVLDLVTGQTFTVRGRPLDAWPDDGSLDGSMLARAGGENGLASYDPATGEPRWRAPGAVEGRALVLDGRVIRVTSRELTAVDGRTGQTVWRTQIVRPARTSLVTDGRLVVVTQLDGDRGLVLGAYGLDDGRSRWTVDIADDVAVLTVVGGQLFGWTGEQMVALTPPG